MTVTMKSINSAKSLEELKQYCCPKVAHKKEWYLGCLDCSQSSKCHCGKRAIELMNAQTKPTVRKRDKDIDDSYRQIFTEALKDGDPIGYVAKTKGLTRYQASNMLGRWRKKYPDILNKIGYVKKCKGPQMAGQYRHEAALKKVETAFSAKDPVIYVMENFGKEEWRAKYEIKRWADRYPDLAKKYHIPEYLIKIKETRVLKKEEPKPMDIQEEEVSVEDFLEEMAEPVKPKEKLIAEPVIKAKTVTAMNSPEDLLKAAMDAKKKELDEEINELQKQIHELREMQQVLTRSYYILTGKVPG